jgi:hypothetical protein
MLRYNSTALYTLAVGELQHAFVTQHIYHEAPLSTAPHYSLTKACLLKYLNIALVSPLLGTEKMRVSSSA